MKHYRMHRNVLDLLQLPVVCAIIPSKISETNDSGKDIAPQR